MIPYFAYGSYLDPQKIAEMTQDAPLLSPATLLGWKVAFNQEGLLTLEPSQEESVIGALCRFRDRNWREVGQIMESIGPYERLPLEVNYWGEVVQAETYYLNGSGNQPLT